MMRELTHIYTDISRSVLENIRGISIGHSSEFCDKINWYELPYIYFSHDTPKRLVVSVILFIRISER